MQKNNNKINSIIKIIDRFELPNRQIFKKTAFREFNKSSIALKKLNYSEKQIEEYSNIYEKNGRIAKALLNLKYFSAFIHLSRTPFCITTTFEALALIFLLDEIADNDSLPFAYRKKFLENFYFFIKNISVDTIITAKDIKQKEMQKIWLNYFKKIYYKKDTKKQKWIKATNKFIKGMLNELKNKKYKTLDGYLKNAIPSSGAFFYWQSVIEDAGYSKQNNARYNYLSKLIGKFLRLTNDFTQIKEDKNKITALKFCRNKIDLKNIFEKELIIIQKSLKKDKFINKKIRLTMWRSVIFLYYFYQEKNFWGEYETSKKS